ncbi:SprT-like protease [Gordonia phage Switzerland]|nr:SprT-like protease [Gordonia phage Switzerland]
MDRTMTQTEAREIAHDLMLEHGLLLSWTFKFDRARRRAGQCHYGKREISLSAPLLSVRSYEESLNTITHEIAHALVGAKAGHGPEWARKHRELGGDGERCFTLEASDPTAPWIGTCGHGKTWDRYRAPKLGSRWSCKCVPGEKTPVVWERRVNAA